MRVDTDPVDTHDPAKGSIAQCDFAFLQVDASKSDFKSDVSKL
jgi:hypothetical protein